MRAVARLGAMRVRAVARMDSTCDIRHESGTTTAGTQVVPAWAADYTDHPCRLSTYQASSSTASLGEVEVEQATRVLNLPHDTRLADNTVARITVGEWADTYWRVRESTGADQKTALRVHVEQIAKPEGWV